MIYFIYDPQDSVMTYRSEAEFIQAMSDFDFMGRYCDDGWSPEVENVIAGYAPLAWQGESNSHASFVEECDYYATYQTHTATMFDKVGRPDDAELDQDGQCENGLYWGEFDYVCNYRFEKIEKG